MAARTPRKAGGGARSAARLGAVQALYQIEADPQQDPRLTAEEFRAHRLGKEIDGELYAAADASLFEDILLGVCERQTDLDERIRAALVRSWPLNRLEAVMRAILRAGAYELLSRPDVPTAVIINEYLDIAHAFFDGEEPRFANGVLDKLARDIRGSGQRGSAQV